MKVLACIALFVLLGVGANGQQSVGGKIFAETSAMSEKVVKGSPFTADAVNESVQVLADGNRIVRSSTNKLYRNSEGRFRREITGGSGGSLGSFYSIGSGITILDPVLGQRLLLDSNLRTARIGSFKPFVGLTAVGPLKAPVVPATPAQAALADKKSAELRAIAPAGTVVEAKAAKAYLDAAKAHSDATRVYAETIVSGQGTSFIYSTGGSQSKYETRKEDLGVQNIEGVDAEGTRTITTIPAGDIGNERPIEIIYEKWYSKELQLVVMSKSSDPRFGEQTYRLTNIVRSEPEPSLFEVPSGFKVLNEPAVSYTISPAPTGGVKGTQNVTWTKPVVAPKPVPAVATTKP